MTTKPSIPGDSNQFAPIHKKPPRIWRKTTTWNIHDKLDESILSPP